MEKRVAYPKGHRVQEFAKIFRLSAEAVRSMIRNGEIPAIRIGRQYRIPQDVIDRYFAQALPPEERGFGMWRAKPVSTLTYLNRLRRQDRRTSEVFLKDMAEDE